MDFLERRFQRHTAFDFLKARQAWVSERPQPRRVQSETRVNNDSSHQPFPSIVRRSEVAGRPGHFTNYLPAKQSTSEHILSRRQKSLPSRKPGLDADWHKRQTNSAPDKEQAQSQRNTKVVASLSRSRVEDFDTGPEMLQRTHGISTRAHDENYHRSNKFATSWAQVRAENLALRDGSPCDNLPTNRTRDNSDSPPRVRLLNSETSKERSLKRQEHLPFKPSPRQSRKMTRGRASHRRTQANMASHSSRSPNVSQNQDKSTSSQRSAAETDSNITKDSEEIEGDDDESADRHGSKERKVAKRPPWNNRMNIVVDSKPPPPKMSSKAYLKGLTFKPTLTSKEDVFMAYTNDDRIVPFDGEFSGSEDDEAYLSPTYDSDAFHSNDSSPARSNERVLNRREAEKYIKMTGVYGSDAYKNQRKEWFLQKLAKVQEEKAKLTEEQRKQAQKKREADRKRQQEQLDYVRNKFRNRQFHRFRTQYVTSRILEHERCNRHEYGLPEDYDDPWAAKPNDSTSLEEDRSHDRDAWQEDHHKEKEVRANGPSLAEKVNGKQQQKLQQPYKPERHRQPHKQNQQRQGKQEKTDADADAETTRGMSEQQKERHETRQVASEGNSSPVASQVTCGYESEKFPGDHPSEKENSSSTNYQKTTSKKQSGTLPSDRLPRVPSEHIYLKEGPVRKTLRQRNNKDYSKAQISKSGLPANKNKPSSNQNKQTTNTADSKTADVSEDNATVSPNIKDTGEANAVMRQQSEQPNEGNDEALVFTGHFRQERDRFYHQIHKPHKDPSRVGVSKTAVDESKHNGHAQDSMKIGSSVESRRGSKPSVDSPNKQKEVRLPPTQSDNPKSSDQNKGNISSQNSNNSVLDSKNVKSSQHSITGPNELSGDNKIITDGGKSTQPQPTAKNKGSESINKNLNNEKTISNTNKAPTDAENRVSNDMVSSGGAMSNENLRVSSNRRAVDSAIKSSQPKAVSGSNKPSVPSSHTTSAKDQNNASADTARQPTVKNVASNDNKKDVTVASKDRPSKHTANTKSGRDASSTHPRSQKDDIRQKPGRSQDSARKKTRGKASLAAMMFDVNTGPTWDPKSKVPKMEGIDTVVVPTKDGKGRVVMRKHNVKDVLNEANNALKVSEINEPSRKKSATTQWSNRMASPDVTLGSDFDVDDDEDETTDDIFERLRKKYNIQIDSDDEEDSNIR